MCILLNVLMHQWPESAISFPSIGTIASRMGVSKRTIQRGVSNLESLGHILNIKTYKYMGKGAESN